LVLQVKDKLGHILFSLAIKIIILFFIEFERLEQTADTGNKRKACSLSAASGVL